MYGCVGKKENNGSKSRLPLLLCFFFFSRDVWSSGEPAGELHGTLAAESANKKDDSPLLKAEVCCLKKIPKGGFSHKKLMAGGINTVQVFLRCYVLYPDKLHSLLGTDKVWEETLKHALQCELGNEHYFYRTSGMEVALVFNSIFQLVGANIDGFYYPLVDLSASQKVTLNRYKKLAYENPRDIVKFWDSLDGSLPRFLPAMNVTYSSGSSLSEPDIFCGVEIFMQRASK